MSVVADAADNERLDPKVWRIAAVVLLGPFMTLLDSTVVNLSLSAIREDLHASIASAQWVVSGYLLALALVLPINGWLVDRLGAKRLYLACFSAFALASLLCGAARTMDELIVARVAQGMAGGLLAPMTQLMMARVAGRQMARVMGYCAPPILIAPILGPVMAGAILKYGSWNWLFFLNLPVGILAIGLAALLLPADQAAGRKRPFDLSGFLVISPGLSCLLYGLEEASHRRGGYTLLAGLVLMAAFVWQAVPKGNAALIDLHLFKNRTFSWSAATQFLSNAVAYGVQFLVPLYLINGCGLSATSTGWILAPVGLGMLVTFPLLGFLTEKFGYRVVSTSGAFLAFAGTVPFIWMCQHHFSLTWTVVSLLIRGIGHSVIGIPSVSAAYASLPKDQLASANTAMNIVQRLGGPVAVTLTAILMSLSTTSLAPSPANSFLAPFLLLVFFHLLALAAATRLPSRVHPA